MIIQNYQHNINNKNSSLSFLSKTKVVSNAVKRTTNLNKIGVGVAGIIGGLLVAKQIENANLFEKCMQLKDSGDFENYKNSLLKFLSSNNYDKGFIDNIKGASGIEELDFEFEVFTDRTLFFDIDDEILEKIERRGLTTEVDKFINDNEIKNSDKVIPVVKLFSKTDIEPEILDIKNELKKKHKQTNFFFNNDLETAKSCYEVFKILDKNNIHFDGTIIVINEFIAAGINVCSSEGPCVIVNPKSWQLEDTTTTNLLLHEILHTLQPRTLEFANQNIPKEYKEIIKNVSEYADDNYAHEVHCELYVKKLTVGLSDKEEEVFNYLGGTFTDNKKP